MQDHLLATALEQTIHRYGEDAGALSQAARHHLSSPGKRTRSKLFFAATPNTQNIKALVHAAAAVELIHEASIVHDDIQDQTERRRGMPTVWRHTVPTQLCCLATTWLQRPFVLWPKPNRSIP